jgi:hypothetical protein
MQAAFYRLIQEHRLRPPYRRVPLKAMAVQIPCDILRLPEVVAGVAQRPGDPRVQRFVELVAARFRGRCGVDPFGQALGFSPWHLGRLCREAKGLSAQGRLEAATRREACCLLV